MNAHELNRRVATLAVAMLLAQTPLPVHALDQWETVNDSQLLPGPSRSSDIGTDASGSLLYSVGSSTQDAEGNRAAVVLGSSDRGATWAVLDVYWESGWPYAHLLGFCSDASGGLYTAGQFYNALGPESAWFVRESHDGGVSWTTESYQPLEAPFSSCVDVKVSASGDVYAAGRTTALGEYQGSIINVNPSWVVRKRAAAPRSEFQTVDTVTMSSGNPSARAIGFHSGGVFVAGRLWGPYGWVWTVRRSTDDGQNWETVDSLRSADSWTGWLSGSAEDIAVDRTTDAIYVAGSGSYRNSPNRKAAINDVWLVRRSTDGGDTWTTVDSFIYGSDTKPRASGIIFDPAGSIFVCGFVTTAQGDRWLVRKGTPGTTLVRQGKNWVETTTVSWVTTDDFQLAPGQLAQAEEITRDDLGNIYVTGRAVNAAGVEHWITRKLAAPAN